MIDFNFTGEPMALPRARHGMGRVYNPAEYRKFKEALHWDARAQMGRLSKLHGPVWVKCEFIRGIPPSWSTKKRAALCGHPSASKPDVDNYAKAVMDALTGAVWEDDDQVVDLHCIKRWAKDGEEPGTRVQVGYAFMEGEAR